MASERIYKAMRKRMISTEFWHDEKIAALTHFERLAFIGCWCVADDRGVLEFSPHSLKMQIFGGDEAITKSNCLAALRHLLELGLLRSFIAVPPPSGRKLRGRPFAPGPKRWLHIPSFLLYQQISHPAASIYPQPPSPEEYSQAESVEFGNKSADEPVFQESGKLPDDSGIGHTENQQVAEASVDCGNLPQVSGALRQTAPQLSLVKTPLDVCSEVVIGAADESPAPAAVENFVAFQRPKKINFQPSSALPETPENPPNSENAAPTNGQKTVAFDAQQADLAHETLIAFAEHILRRIQQPHSTGLLAVIADALIKFRAENSGSWRDSHNAIFTAAAVAAHDAPPENWLDWFRTGQWRRVHSDPPTHDQTPTVPTGEPQ